MQVSSEFLEGGTVAAVSGFFLWLVWLLVNATGEKVAEGFLIALFRRTNKAESSRVMYITKMSGWRLKVQRLDLKDEARTAIFRDFITIKLDVMDRRLMEISELVRKGGLNRKEDFQLATLKMVKEMVGEYEALAVESGIPKVCIKRFEETHRSALDFMMMNLEFIGFSGIYDDNNERLAALFFLYISVLESSLSAYERTLSTLNGDLTGAEYKGLVVQ